MAPVDETDHNSKGTSTQIRSAVQWLVRKVAEISPRVTGMGNDAIKTHLVLYLYEDMLDHGVPNNVNSAYAESAHIPLAKITSRKTQIRVGSFTKQAAHRYIEYLVVSLASADISGDAIFDGGLNEEPDTAVESVTATTGRLAGRRFIISRPPGSDHAFFNWIRRGPSDDPQKTSYHITFHHTLPNTAYHTCQMVSCPAPRITFPERVVGIVPAQTSMMVNHGMIMQ